MLNERVPTDLVQVVLGGAVGVGAGAGAGLLALEDAAGVFVGAGLAASVLLVSVAAVAAGAGVLSPAFSAGAPVVPPRKSVTYQPEPLS